MSHSWSSGLQEAGRGELGPLAEEWLRRKKGEGHLPGEQPQFLWVAAGAVTGVMSKDPSPGGP